MGSLAERLEVTVVDDTAVSRALIVDALEQIGITRIAQAKNGTQAYTDILAKPTHLVISDMNMPGMDGLALLKKLRETPATARIGFILVTGSPDKTLVERGKALQLNNYVAKPFTVDAVRKAIEAVVGRLQ
ncbi:two-component system chemotaxis response regulator CheY [Rhodoblastus acidophilus]|uniref:response regulator n=1 Tax=Rhodoblastus acidophilus TaxID=1074 RepID=UPI00161FC845|nr:response regulator [Rhodoblastus acidophilus]MCW2283278.1 two-component system chemotaxis response regulator CheY [Rhodoblastus acidophilus]MCW2332138.1 two-component system chemotaxis response regulator CheY [Rhodoblastus acidophilus]